MKKLSCCICCFFLLLTTGSRAGTLIHSVQLTDASAEAAMAKPRAAAQDAAVSGEYTLTWQLTRPGRVSVYICDLKGRIVRSFHDGEQTDAGTYSLSWDGTDDSGTRCAGGLYFPVIRIKSKDMGVETYNPTALPWGGTVLPDDVRYDRSAGLVTYTLVRPALVRIRAGEKDGGPLYRTVTDWALRSAGPHAEPWDGLDATGRVKVTDRDKFNIAFDGFTVPENSVMLRHDPVVSQKARSTPAKTFPVFPPSGKKLAYFTALPHGLEPDLAIAAAFVSGAKKKKNIYQLRGRVPIRLSLTRGALGRNPKEGIELYLYVDGRMIHEGPAQSLPATVLLDTGKFTAGRHLVTLNLRTSDDRAASYSMNVLLAGAK